MKLNGHHMLAVMRQILNSKSGQVVHENADEATTEYLNVLRELDLIEITRWVPPENAPVVRLTAKGYKLLGELPKEFKGALHGV